MKIYTRKGDDGTTGLYFGGRVPKDSARPAAYGDVDEAQAAIGVARAHTPAGGELNGVLVELERDLWILMADLATGDDNRDKLSAGVSLVTDEMVLHLENLIDDYTARFELPREFVVPGQEPVSAFLDLARTVIRRAERSSISAASEGSLVVQYLNRLSDLVWTLARWQEGTSVTAKSVH
ncbi:MAG TPA: cob(I)yrinic acid a,c-diamide adenosyltransferase [Microthrixaceae bacterium]|nr:cob(I)yrinic acid a,c-diamide adenosyltransferase [Microthrixaceae bacterium]